ncbi:hypothetical protein diail_6742 [Diaporthe ilicicola]|nr:hypothetical protein diail_6742 [Diaporthe ilicicola]
MRSSFRNTLFNIPDDAGQLELQQSARQKQQDEYIVDDDDIASSSNSNSSSDHTDVDDVLPGLVKLTLAQQRIILSLCDVTKEAGTVLQIISARLDLFEEELSIMRSSLADQVEPSLFSGVRTDSSFGGIECDTTDDYVPIFDLSDIGATLAAGPGPGSDSGRPRYLAREGSYSPRASKQRRLSPRTEREEHVKRTRISYDGFGGQDPKIPPSTYIFSSSTYPRQSTATTTDKAPTSKVPEADFQEEPSMDTGNDPNVMPQPSLLGKLCRKMVKLLLGA